MTVANPQKIRIDKKKFLDRYNDMFIESGYTSKFEFCNEVLDVSKVTINTIIKHWVINSYLTYRMLDRTMKLDDKKIVKKIAFR